VCLPRAWARRCAPSRARFRRPARISDAIGRIIRNTCSRPNSVSCQTQIERDYSWYIALSIPVSREVAGGIPMRRRMTRPVGFQLDFPQVLHMSTVRGATFNVSLNPFSIHRVGKGDTPDQSKKESLLSEYSTELSTWVLHRHSGLVRTLSTELSTGRVACG
jgi:hypothetical protein